MTVDINTLSSDQLFELARKRRQEEEQRVEARESAIRGLKQQRAQLVAEHAKALESVDYQIRDLHNKRAQLVIRHKAAVDTLDQQVAELQQEAKSDQGDPRESKPSPAATPAPATRSGGRSPLTADTLHAVMVELIKGRTYLSESLLKEKLRGRGIDVSQLGKQLEQMTRAGRIVSRGSGNYALGKQK